MKPLSVKTSDCSCEDLLKIAQKYRFSVVEGSKHCKIKSQKGETITVIPRHNSLNKHTAKGILERFIEFGADIDII